MFNIPILFYKLAFIGFILVNLTDLNGKGNFLKIFAREGTLFYEDGSKVNLFGINFQPSLSFEHAAYMENQKVLMPLRSKDLKKTTDESFEEIELLGAELIRIHLAPSDFSDRDGNLVQNIWLDMLDYTISQATNRGFYVYLTFINELAHEGTQFRPIADSFSTKPREDWIYDLETVRASKNFIRQLLNRTNPYSNILYKETESLALVEPINEPAFIRFQKWSKKNPEKSKDDFSAYRYRATLNYLNEMVDLFREEGLEIPVIWNANWPKNISGKLDVYDAIADSKVDGISFCNYPGQDQLKPPMWANTENLDGTNFLPYLQSCYEEWNYLGYLKDSRFKKMVKVVYEYETICQQTGYMYPAMAKLFRSLGVQIAAQWTYALSSYFTHRGGTHAFSLKGSPNKAASFMVAKQVFKKLPVGSAYLTTSPQDDRLSFAEWSFPENHSHSNFENELIYSNGLSKDFSERAKDFDKIVGTGSSSLIEYSGNGLYFLEKEENESFRFTVYPDRFYINPHWNELHTGEPVLELREKQHSISLNRSLFPTDIKYKVLFKKGSIFKEIPVSVNSSSYKFEGSSGEYLIVTSEELKRSKL